MIFVAVGTQDKQFTRLLKIVDNAIKKGYIKDEVVVQRGHTNYESNNMKCYTFLSDKDIDNYIDKSDLIITHGGIGIITNSLKKNKKVFAMARLEKYSEHINDHQVQIVDEFNKLGYLKKIDDFDDLVREYQNLKRFKPKKFKTDNTKLLNIITEFIG